MIAKLIVSGSDREAARQGLIDALDGLELGGISTNRSWLRDILAHADVAAGRATTAWLDGFRPWAEELSQRQLLTFLAAVAVDHVIGIEEAREGDDPWASLRGWRLLSAAGHPARLPVEIEDQTGQRHRLIVEGTRGRYGIVAGDGAAIALAARRTPEGLVMNSGHHGRTVRIGSDGGQIHARIDGVSRSFRIVDPQALDHAAAAAGGGDIVAAMPGLIVEILARPGETVEAGQPIIVMEAMKMMHGLTARGTAVIAEISCRAGEAVEMGRTLVRMEGAA
jgi:acetyl/propionyl-CoA carboxylase alpha subunit